MILHIDIMYSQDVECAKIKIFNLFKMPSIYTYTTSEKVQILKWYFGGNSAVETIKLFKEAYFDDKPIPTVKTISTIIGFDHYGHRLLMYYMGVTALCKKCCLSTRPERQSYLERENCTEHFKEK